MIQVANKKTWPGAGEYIGRPSILGNPFRIGKDGTREEVIHKYRQWLWTQIKAKGPVYDELIRLSKIEDLTLICHCKPLACHGDVVKAAIEWIRREGNHGETDQH